MTSADLLPGALGDQPAGNLRKALDAAKAAYATRNPLSRKQHEIACLAMPGGNTRSVLYHDPFPLAVERGEGAYIWDLDGHRYVDFLGDFTSGLYGHSNPVIQRAIEQALAKGLSLSGHNVIEPELAGLIVQRFPSIELVRFTNSGTEANLMALSAARVHTGRSKVMVFSGGYHGGLLSFGGSTPLNVPFEFVVGKYNDVSGAERLIRENAADLAAILVEPIQGASGCIPASTAFLAHLRKAASEVGAVLIFDEVMTSRLSVGGRQLTLDIIPDITTLGKYFGGGMSFGAFGGNSEIMLMFDPREPGHLVHSGTFNNNVLSMAAGAAGLSTVLTAETLELLNNRGDNLRRGLNELCVRHGADMQFTGDGSLFTMHPTSAPVSSVEDLAACSSDERDLFYFHLLANDIYIARRGFFALMLPIDDAHCARVLEVVDGYLANGKARRGASDA